MQETERPQLKQTISGLGSHFPISDFAVQDLALGDQPRRKLSLEGLDPPEAQHVLYKSLLQDGLLIILLITL